MTLNPRPPDDDAVDLETKPFLSHLEDLRWTLFRCVGALLVAVIGCAFGVKYILKALYHPYREAGGDPAKLINIDVTGPFAVHVEISLFGGVIVALPFILYFLGQFLLPALTFREKGFLAPVFAAGAGLFAFGVCFCYFIVLTTALRFFNQYSTWLGISPTWTLKNLIDFEVQMLLGFGIAFEMPLVLLVLNLIGIVSADQMASKRRYAFFIIFIAATCIVPSTDIFSLSVMTFPLYFMFEGSIFIARIFERRKAAKAKAEADS
jgi:sec-independent protein translocase protein TatC